MKQKLTKLLCSVFLVAFAIPAIAQSSGGSSTRTITGKVTDSEGAPIIGAVVMASQREATTTNSEGRYTLAVQSPDAVLRFSCMGYRPRSENTAGRTVVDVSLETDNQLLEDVVVVGYGVQKKVNLTGSVASIDFSKTSESRSIISTSAALAGLAAGMNVTQSSGQPGSDNATIRIRADGSSRFGSNNRYGIFPSFSAGWKIHEERFMEGTEDWLSNLKLRASWGKAGNNQGIGNYAWQAVYATQNVVVDGSGSKGLYISSLSNADLKWETTATTDIGLDMGFFDNRLTAEIDYYRKNTTDILYTPTIYMTMGEVSGVPSNLGSVVNKGVELALNWKSRIGKDFSYYAGVNFSYNKNRVTRFKGDLVKTWTDGVYTNNLSDVTAGYGSGKLCEGHALGEHYLRRLYKGNGRGYRGGAVDVNAGPKDGMIRTQQDFEWVQAMLETGYTFNGVTALSKDQLWYGDLIYADRNGDGNYGDDNDMDFNGRTSTPSYNLGVNLGFAWKGLDFNMTWSGAFDYYIIWNALYYNGTQTTNGHGISERVADNHYYFDPENPADARTNLKGAYPRLTFGTPGDNRQASEFYEYKGDYLKLKNVQIGYTLPSRITKKFYVQQLRFFVSGENLLTITDYPGLDPEKGSAIGYPLMRSVTFGAQITF